MNAAGRLLLRRSSAVSSFNCETFLLQNTCSNARAITASAVNRSWLRAIQFTDSLSQLWQKNVTRTGNVPVLPFTRGTNIDNLQARGPLIQFMHTHLPNLCLFESRGLPGFHSTDQIAGEL